MSEFSDFEDEEGVEEPVLSENDQVEEGEDEVEVNPLTQEIIVGCLSLLCKTGNGLAHAYVRLDIHQRDISDIGILAHFVHLRYVGEYVLLKKVKQHTDFKNAEMNRLLDECLETLLIILFAVSVYCLYKDVSSNKLRDISPLNYLTHMLSLKADKNLLKSAKLNELPYLQHANFSYNKLTDMEGIDHHLLEVLNVSGNEIVEISGINPKKLSRLATLEIRANKLTTTAGVFIPNLKKLYIGENTITKIEDLARLEHLTTLHLRQNNLSNLDGFSEVMKSLQYVNLRKNDISDFNEIKKLQCLPLLRALVLRENPICYEESYRTEVLVILRRLERLDQDVYAEDERQEAEEIYNQRLAAENEDGSGAIEVINSEEDED